MALMEREIRDDFEPLPNAPVDTLKARYQSLIASAKVLNPDVVPAHIAKCEEIYASARMIAGQVSAHYYEEYITFKIGADQTEIHTYRQELAKGGILDKDAKQTAKLAKLEMQKFAGIARAEYIRWQALYSGLENFVNSLKDRIRVLQAGL